MSHRSLGIVHDGYYVQLVDLERGRRGAGVRRWPFTVIVSPGHTSADQVPVLLPGAWIADHVIPRRMYSSMGIHPPRVPSMSMFHEYITHYVRAVRGKSRPSRAKAAEATESVGATSATNPPLASAHYMYAIC